jgi:hypothetical protein
MKLEVDLSSSSFDKTVEIAHKFLGKLISPALEEYGLMYRDNAKLKRFKNQVDLLSSAEKFIKEKNIEIKEIPIKILSPILEYASLEEDSILKLKWKNMLVNMANSDLNFQNNIFPYILSQIAIEEYNELYLICKLESKFKKTKIEFEDRRKVENYNFSKETTTLSEEVKKSEQEGFKLKLKQFEIANLQRLGLIKELPPKIFIEEFKTGASNLDEVQEEWHQIDAEYETEDFGYRITELGELFCNICELKTNSL